MIEGYPLSGLKTYFEEMSDKIKASLKKNEFKSGLPLLEVSFWQRKLPLLIEMGFKFDLKTEDKIVEFLEILKLYLNELFSKLNNFFEQKITEKDLFEFTPHLYINNLNRLKLGLNLLLSLVSKSETKNLLSDLRFVIEKFLQNIQLNLSEDLDEKDDYYRLLKKSLSK